MCCCPPRKLWTPPPFPPSETRIALEKAWKESVEWALQEVQGKAAQPFDRAAHSALWMR